MEKNNYDKINDGFFHDKSKTSEKEDIENPANFNHHQSKEVDKIEHKAYNNIDDIEAKKELSKLYLLASCQERKEKTQLQPGEGRQG